MNIGMYLTSNKYILHYHNMTAIMKMSDRMILFYLEGYFVDFLLYYEQLLLIGRLCHVTLAKLNSVHLIGSLHLMDCQDFQIPDCVHTATDVSL